MPGVRTVRSDPNSASALSANTKRETEKEETMGRRTLTLEDQLRGIRAALKSKRTPPQLKPGLTKRKEFLEKSLGRERQRNKKSSWW
jgi:hypothetical protein